MKELSQLRFPTKTPEAQPCVAPACPPRAVSHGLGFRDRVFIHSKLDEAELSPATFRVYAHLARRFNGRVAWPGIASMARTCRLHPQTVREAIKELTRRGMVRVVKRPGDTSHYFLTPHALWHTPADPNPCETDTPPSDSQGTPANPIQDHPCETDAGKGNPVEGNPKKEITNSLDAQFPRSSIPSNEDEAAAWAALDGVPADFARRVFNHLAGVGWLDGCKRPVVAWRPHIKSRWTKEQTERAERQPRHGKATAAGKATLWELKTRLDVVESTIEEHPARDWMNRCVDEPTVDMRLELKKLTAERQRPNTAIIEFGNSPSAAEDAITGAKGALR